MSLQRPRIPWWLGLSGALAALLVLVLVFVQVNWLPSPSDLLDEESKDRSGPVLLKSVRDLSRYEAAAGNFQVVVDLDRDATFFLTRSAAAAPSASAPAASTPMSISARSATTPSA